MSLALYLLEVSQFSDQTRIVNGFGNETFMLCVLEYGWIDATTSTSNAIGTIRPCLLALSQHFSYLGAPLDSRTNLDFARFTIGTA